jgi:hypothetical protein
MKLMLLDAADNVANALMCMRKVLVIRLLSRFVGMEPLCLSLSTHRLHCNDT